MANKKFKIGLCMTGAASAGAYTAGVVDYLLEALNEWELRRNDPTVPRHEVNIPVIGGASAGGMTGILIASAINNPMSSVQFFKGKSVSDEHPENKFYSAWVDLEGADTFSQMLATDDIEKTKKVVSLFNSSFIDKVVARTLCEDPKKWIDTPAYFKRLDNRPVKVFVTLTNLGGFPYYIGMNAEGEENKFYMSLHNDYSCFEIMDGVVTPSGMEWMPLNFKTNAYLEIARNSALATGAFPGGFAPRILERETKYVKNIPWLKDVFSNSPLIGDVVKSLNVDGGVLNNEPFLKVRYLLDEEVACAEGMPFETAQQKKDASSSLHDKNSDYNSFENTMLMVDPLPPGRSTNFNYDDSLLNVVPDTFYAMISQLQGKPGLYENAAYEKDASKFIIIPSREIRDKEGKVIKKIIGERAIACGSLGGFGGFLSKDFRVHDYFLGRFNCEIFLRDYFTVPASALKANPIFMDGYKNVPDLEKYASSKTLPGEEKRYQIIPIFSESEQEFKMPTFPSGLDWPIISEKKIDKLTSPMKARLGAVLNASFNITGLFGFLVKSILSGIVSKKILTYIKQSLDDWNLLSK